MTESTVKMRSGRIVAESEHEEVRLEVEAVATLHSIGNALAESTESEHADGRTVVGAPAALHLDKTKWRDDMSKSQENKDEKTRD